MKKKFWVKLSPEDKKLFKMIKSLYKDDSGEPLEASYSQLRFFRSIFKKEHPRLHIMTHTQFGKQISHNVPVLTTKGWKTHGELEVGDYVFGTDGNPKKVLGLSQEYESTKEVEFSNGEKIRCHKNHEWVVHNRSWKKRGKWFKAMETKKILEYPLKTGGAYNFSVPKIEPLEFQEKKLSIDPYTLGAWLGDGTSTKPALTVCDKEIIDFIPYKVSSVQTHKTTGIKTYYFYKSDFYLKELFENKHIPDIYKYSSRKQRLALLAGLIDTDGTVNPKYRKNGHRNGRVYIINTNKRLVNDIEELIISLGMRPSTSKVLATTSSSGIKGKKDVYYIGFDPYCDIPTKVPRKKIYPKEKIRHITIRDIKEINPEKGRCIQVEGGVYLVGKRLIPTHNSLFSALAVLTRITIFPEKWCIVAPSQRKAKIIMGYIIQHSFDNAYIKNKLKLKEGSLDRLRRERSSNRLTFTVGDEIGEVFILSAEARRTSDVEEALMGYGSPNIIEDESALIPDKIHSTAMRMLGGHQENFLCKVGNPFRRNHFLKSYKSDRYKKFVVDWRKSVDEGRLTEDFVNEMREEAFFDIMYNCEFPDSALADDEGWIPLFLEEDLKRTDMGGHFGEARLGCDIATGEGDNNSVITKRSAGFAEILFRSPTEDIMDFVGKIIMMGKKEKYPRTYLDKVGVGAGAMSRLREVGFRATPVNAGEKPADDTRFYNKRAEMFWRLKEWIEKGGKLSNHDSWDELLDIRYKPDSSGRIRIMSKDKMRRNGIMSPDTADALALTFYDTSTRIPYMSPEEKQFYRIKRKKQRKKPSVGIRKRHTSY